MQFITGLALGLGLGWFIFQRRNPPQDTIELTISEFQTDNFTVKGEIESMELKEGKKAVLVLKPKTKAGHTAAIQAGSVRVNSSNPAVVSVETDPTNELAIICRGLDGSANESVVVEVRADADRGEGVREIIATKSIVCTTGDAFVVEFEEVSIDDDDDAQGPFDQPPPTEPEAPAEPTGDTPSDPSGEPVTPTPPNIPDDAPPSPVPPSEPEPGTVPADPFDPAPPVTPPDAPTEPLPEAPATPNMPEGQPIEGETPTNPANPVEGTEADSTPPGDNG